MDQSVVVLSFIVSKNSQDLSHFAALKIEEGLPPVYLLSSFSERNAMTMDFTNERRKIIDFLNGASTVFLWDYDTVRWIKKILEFEFDSRDVFIIKDFIVMLYPAFSQLRPVDLCIELQLKFPGSFFSPAQKECRLGWGFLRHCYTKGLASDIGYLSKLQTYIEDLSIAKWVAWLKREIMIQYPDRIIQTGPFPRKREGSLFSDFYFQDSTLEKDEKIESSPWVIQCFQAGGLLSQNLPGYEDRLLQVAMARELLKGFQESMDIVVEAGTGTGKSIAYLIPALWWARKNQKRVIIATHTITLQEQLYGKDLPFLQKILPFSFKTALLKGKNNYVCLNSFFQEPLHSDQFTDREKLARAGMFSWLGDTCTGDLGELPYSPGSSPIWKRFGADNSICMPSNCRYAGQCFMLLARKRAEEADLIVINHSLLLADVKTNYNILPEHGDLIIDEAHHLYQTALKQLGFELSFEDIHRQIESMKTGLFYTLKKSYPVWREIFPAINWAEFQSCYESLFPSGTSILEQAKDLFNLGRQILAGRLNLCLDQGKMGESVYAALIVSIENLIYRLKEYIQLLDKINSCLFIESQQLEPVRYELIKNKNEIVQITDGLNTILTGEEYSRVTYLEKTNLISLKNTLIDVSGILREKIFDKNNCTVLTSATLSVSQSFSCFARDVGLDEYHSIRLNSPFDYDRQMLFCVVNDMPINHWTEEVLAARAASFICQIAEVMQGRTLILCTSYRYLRLVQEELCARLKHTELRVLAQGIDGSREDLLQLFMKTKNTILLGTNSFWEGIDVPGEALRCVIMAKLPFWPPDSPIMEAKAKLLESQGLDPFRELHLPEAIIRFRQGFGRLIRTREDKGVVILLDDRILKKQYGRLFIQSLPIRSYYQGSSEKVIQQVGRWA
ncbi:MAG: putative ATP-dependent helicase DinG [Candidatus Dichloromethanomonas elyunquensis]|nr:MAG: putative ATP-dependent helicase DinG [Candidatus Dichloromethanomonas elyunquensis]